MKGTIITIQIEVPDRETVHSLSDKLRDVGFFDKVQEALAQVALFVSSGISLEVQDGAGSEYGEIDQPRPDCPKCGPDSWIHVTKNHETWVAGKWTCHACRTSF